MSYAKAQDNINRELRTGQFRPRYGIKVEDADGSICYFGQMLHHVIKENPTYGIPTTINGINMNIVPLDAKMIFFRGYLDKYACKKTMNKFMNIIAPPGSGAKACVVELDHSQEAMKNMDSNISYSYDRVNAYFDTEKENYYIYAKPVEQTQIPWKNPKTEKPNHGEWYWLTDIDKNNERHITIGYWDEEKQKFLLYGKDVLDEIIAYAPWPEPFQGDF